MSNLECRSLQGHVVMRQHGAVCWGLLREARISGSSCVGEIKAMDEGTKTTQYVRHIESELAILSPGPTPLFNDNKGGADWCETGKITKKLRHENIREWRVREVRRAGEITIEHIPGKGNPADIFTKEHKSPADFALARDIIVAPGPDGGCQTVPSEVQDQLGHANAGLEDTVDSLHDSHTCGTHLKNHVGSQP